MKQEVKTKAKENAIVDGPRYECSEMAARFALTWLDRAHHHLKHIGRGKRSFYHDQLVQKVAYSQALAASFSSSCELHKAS